MRRNFRVVTAFVLTLLLVFGSFGMVYATPVNINLEIKDVPKEVESIKVNYDLSGGGSLTINPSPKTDKHWQYVWTDSDKGQNIESLYSIEFYDKDNSLIDIFVFTSATSGDIQKQGNKNALMTYSASGGTWNADASQNFFFQSWRDTTPPAADPAIELKKVVSPDKVNSKDAVVTYTFKINNTGNVDLENVSLEDDAIGFSTVIGLIEAGDTETVTTTVALQPEWFGEDNKFTNEATVNAVYDNTPVTDSDTAKVTIKKTPPATTSASIDVEKTVNPGSVNAGEAVTYTIVVTNTGNVTLNEVKLSDPMFNGATHGGVYWPVDIGTLAPNASQTYTVNLNAPTESSGSISNTVWANASYNDNPLTASDTAIFTIKTQGGGGDDDEPRLELIKTVDKTTTGAMDAQVTYAFTVKNTGNVELTNVYLEDDDIGFYTTFASIAAGATVTTEKAVTLNSE